MSVLFYAGLAVLTVAVYGYFETREPRDLDAEIDAAFNQGDWRA